MKLVINRCPNHGYWAVSIDDDFGGSGVRVTPSKCCGRWDTVRAFTLTPSQWRELANEAENAAGARERELIAEARK